MLPWILSLTLISASAEIVDRVVADVSGQLILTSDVQLEVLLSERDPLATPFWHPGWHAPIDRLVDAAIVRQASADVGLYDPDREAVVARLQAIKARFPTGAWAELLAVAGADEAQIEIVVRRRLMVDRYLQRNLLTDPAEIEAWQAEAEQHLIALRRRVRIRKIPPRTPGATP